MLRGSELAIAQNWLEEAKNNNKQPPATEVQKGFIGASDDLRDRQEKEKESQQKRTELYLADSLAPYSLSLFNQGKELDALAVHSPP